MFLGGPVHDPIPTSEPRAVTAGDTWQWRRQIAGHRADAGWELVYFLEGPALLDVEGVAEADGAGWLVTATPEETAVLERGAYQLHGFIQQKEADVVVARHRVYRDTLAVAADPAVFDAPRRSHVEEMYELIVARLEGRLPADREQTLIDGTQIIRIPIAELLRLRGVYAELLRQELGGAPVQSVVCRDAV